MSNSQRQGGESERRRAARRRAASGVVASYMHERSDRHRAGRLGTRPEAEAATGAEETRGG